MAQWFIAVAHVRAGFEKNLVRRRRGAIARVFSRPGSPGGLPILGWFPACVQRRVGMIVRALGPSDWPDAEALYHRLTRSGSVASADAFTDLLAHPGTTVFGRVDRGRVVSMATLHVLPNMTYGGRPYGLVENVVTAADCRNQGNGRAVLTHIADTARAAGCYKLMLLTGKGRNARGFYEAVGFSADEKWGMMIRF